MADGLGALQAPPAYDELMALYDAYWNHTYHFDDERIEGKWMVIERDNVDRLDQLASDVEDALAASRSTFSPSPEPEQQQ